MELEALTALQPGLARLMPEVGARMWKAYYAAGARNWPLATWQLKELEKLLGLCMVTRPKYRQDLQAYIDEDLAPLRLALEEEDGGRFQALFADAVFEANEYHRRWKKPWILWKLPDAPPPDLDLTPQTGEGPAIERD
ncbi:MAG: hypothetical protein ABR564_09330 [Candidatus Dormibacteria bacterium]